MLEAFYDKVSGLPPGVLSKKTSTQVFYEISQNAYFVEHVRVVASAGR